MFDGNENNYELWEVKFLGYMRLQKLHEVVVRVEGEKDVPDAGKLANAFAELVQCLDDRSLALVIREAKDDGRKALQVLREHYQGKGKPRIIALYTELTSLEMKEGESTTDYILRAEKAATALKAADSDQRWIACSHGPKRTTHCLQNVCNCGDPERNANDIQ